MPDTAPTRAEIEATRAQAARQLAEHDKALLDKLEAALAVDGVVQLHALATSSADTVSDVGRQLGFLRDMLDGVAASIPRIRGDVTAALTPLPVIGVAVPRAEVAGAPDAE